MKFAPCKAAVKDWPSVPEQGLCIVAKKTQQQKKLFSNISTYLSGCFLLCCSPSLLSRTLLLLMVDAAVADGSPSTEAASRGSYQISALLPPEHYRRRSEHWCSYWAGLRRKGGFHSPRGCSIMTIIQKGERLITLNKTDISNSLQWCHYGWIACQMDLKTAILWVENVFDLSTQHQPEGQQWKECYLGYILESSTFVGCQTLRFHGIKKHSGN